MRLRETGRPAPDIQEITSLENITYDVTTITPIFGGGVNASEPDVDMPIRASAIRGQLRYWWRFLASHREIHPLIDSEELFEQEREIWGGMGEQNKTFSSKIFVRVHDVKNTTEPVLYDGNLVNYVLFPAKEEKRKGIPAKKILNEGIKFELIVTTPPDRVKEIEEVIRWWANFGGIGARARRGLGAVEIKTIKPLTDKDVRPYGCRLAGLNITRNASTAWKNSIHKLQTFRQGKGIGRAAGSDNTKPKKLGQSYWPESDSIRIITDKDANGKHLPKNKTGTFPRAAFGLPIIFDFNVNASAGEPPPTELIPALENCERMASPLIIKPQYIGNKEGASHYLPIALLLPTNHLDGLQLELRGSHNNLPKRISRDDWWPRDEQKQKELAKKITPLANRGSDALSAFMEYFNKG